MDTRADMIFEAKDSSAYIVTGFFTPDYAELGASFAANLRTHAVPHHLYAASASAWQNAILLKPQIVLRAMADYPGRTVVLMDIDCYLTGPMDPILAFQGDVSLFVGVRYHPR